MPGQRLGQIDSPNEFKLTVSLDEFYLSRVSLGLEAQGEVNGETYALRVSRIFPQVENGQFTAELLFDEGSPPALRRGQSLSLRLYLGEAEETLVLPAGAFLSGTGGNWAFVLADGGLVAERRSIRTGRRNNQFVEVTGGLEEGDRVVVSSYEPFGDVDRLELN
jgi:HlyD family secretion protein